jgi:phage baseplate assembly protein W
MAFKDVKDLVIRYKDHPRYNPNKIVEDDEIEVIVQKLEMVLFTNKGEVLGDVDLGANLEYYLWQTKVTTSNLKNKVQEQIMKYIPELVVMGYSLDVQLYEGTVQDILYLNFLIKGYNINFVFD